MLEEGLQKQVSLQLRCERAIGHLDAEKLQLVLIVCAGQAISAHQRLALQLQANHREMPVLEPKTGIARGLETEQPVCPVMNRCHFFPQYMCHGLPLFPSSDKQILKCIH